MLEDQGRQEIRKLEKGLVVLETIAAIAPLMGLLGTVLGMVEVFAVIKEQGIGQTAALSGGISQALLTTVTGLFIGIPVLIAYNYFTNKSEGLVLDIEKYTNQLVQKIIHIKKEQT
jgi:biopolymer transport protein ExbB